ncbi:hypothetical protein Tco_0874261 [Tanacetum coccineum]|uniref:Uncharacterized protein n=1 Tax=Tanacetum coccineum TaxID=301880 RepID=A0ABQ5BL39_9ASTR
MRIRKWIMRILDKTPIKEWTTKNLGIKPQFDETKGLKKEDLNAVYKLLMDRYQNEDWNVVSWKLHRSSGVHTLMTDTGLVIHMLIERKYHLKKKVQMKMLKLKLESKEDSTMALELIRFVKKLVAELEPENTDGDEEDL